VDRRRWILVLAVAALVTVPAAWQASRLRIVTRLVELLPADAAAAADYARFLTLFGGFEKVYAMLRWTGNSDPDPALLAEAAERLGAEVAASPAVAAVRTGLTPGDEAFLLERVLPAAPLFLGDDSELAHRLAPEAVDARVVALRERLRHPAGALEARWMAADLLGLAGGLEGVAGGGALGLVDPLSGAFLATGGDAALVIVTPRGGELDPAVGRELAAALERGADRVAADLGAPLALAAVGGPLYAAQDEEMVREDVARTVAGSGLLVVLLLVAWFGGVGVPSCLVAAVAVGIVWTAGLTRAVHGEISVLGLSFAAMLLGLGVDYGIHGASRFRAGRRAGLGPEAAMRSALREAGPAIAASMATTAAAFLVLALAHFRPVRELGMVMAAGIALILLSSVAVGGSLLVLAPRRPGSARRGGDCAARALETGVAAAVGLGVGRRRAVLAAAGAVTALAGLGIARLELSIDLRSLRAADHPAYAAEELLVEGFGVGLDTSTVVVEGADLGEALDRARRLESAVEDAAGDRVAVTSPAHWLAAGEVVERRFRALAGAPAAAAVAAAEEAMVREGLAPAAFAPALDVLRALARGERPALVEETAWPDWVGELVRRRGDGVAVAVRLATPIGTWPDGPPAAVLAAVEGAVPGAAVASVPRVGAELRRLVVGDLGRLGGWALAAVAGVVLLSFRGRSRPARGALLSLVPVAAGSVWTLGFAGAVGVPIDPFTVVVAPLLLGIGIDDGLHALHGERAHGDLVGSLRANGGAMAVTTLTTCAGFGSLALSRVPSLVRGGVLVAVGTLLCLVATLVLLPALDAGARRGAAR
jgi:hypothetical protein